MKHLLIAVLSVALFAACQPAGASDAPLPEQIAHSVVLIDGERGSGSGFVSGDGLVTTAAHVVTGRTTVIFANGARRVATVEAMDHTRDIAILSVPRIPLSATPLKWSQSPALLGDAVTAYGFPHEADVMEAGFSRTVTLSEGVISARRIRDGVTYLQTDAALGHGNSGGPLINASGEVVGAVTLILTPGGEDAEGMGFAVSH